MPTVTVAEVVRALYLDMKESYPSLTMEWLAAEAEKQIAGEQPTGMPGMYLNRYLEEAGLLK